eukprot:COSAG05_NODE_2335_length_3215_cov_17.188594_2_plen_122_part_00
MGRYEVWATRNVLAIIVVLYIAPPRYYKCTATHGTPRRRSWGVVQQIPKGGYNTQGLVPAFRSPLEREAFAPSKAPGPTLRGINALYARDASIEEDDPPRNQKANSQYTHPPTHSAKCGKL